MFFYEVAPTKIVRQDASTLTYHSETALPVGAIVEIPVGQKRTLLGVIMKQSPKPNYATKAITKQIVSTPLPSWQIDVATWMSQYYHTPLALAWQTMLPRGIDKTRRPKAASNRASHRKRTHFLLNDDQLAALETLRSADATSAILYGVTGSGKTAVYIERVRDTLHADASAMILVPEIALTSQIVDEFSHHFDNCIVVHSRQTEAERHIIWQRILESPTPLVIIGPRSALFMPVADIGIIIIDESHEPSFKQEQSPRYHAATVARFMTARLAKLSLIQGSATPRVADMYAATTRGEPIASLPGPAVDAAKKPHIMTIDMTKRDGFTRHRFLSDALLARLEKTLTSGDQALIFHNRRGTASTTLCEHCGWSAGCPTCFIPLTLHGDHHRLLCHSCGYQTKVPTSCPVCSHADIIHKGIGTKLIESELQRIFPAASIARFDGDTHQHDTVEKRYGELYSGSINLIIGTQVVAKGLDLPHLRTVGIVQADAGLSLPDFSASERTFQLLAQVIGRVGRSTHDTHVIVQSYQPQHPAIVDGISQKYRDFYDRTLQQRHHSKFPPFRHLLMLTCTYKTEAAAIRGAKKLAETLKLHQPKLDLLGPTPHFYERTSGGYRWQIIARSTSRNDLLAALDHLPSGPHWQYELDPLSLL